ncbi:hypothetical protein HDE_09531 [Halotydeus destructor]|nr:hypothetical protein HDE_09531 [Halotydeus destructor]
MARHLLSSFSATPTIMAALRYNRTMIGLHFVVYTSLIAILIASSVFEPTFLPTYASLVFTFAAIVQYFYYIAHDGAMFKLAAQLSATLDPVTISALRTSDRKVSYSLLTITITLMFAKVLLSCFIVSSEFWDLVTRFPDTKYDNILDPFLFAIGLYTVFSNNLYLQFYKHFNVLLEHHSQLMLSRCENVHNDETLKHRKFYTYMMRNYTHHVSVKSEMNQHMALTPFCLTICLFIGDLTGASYLIVAGSKISKIFIFLGILPVFIGGHIGAINLCMAAGRASETLKKAAKGILLVTSQATPHETKGDRRMRRWLHGIVQAEEPEPARVYSLFTVDSQMALAFLGQVLPFTAMIMTGMSSLYVAENNN